jgi:hypothetical protein
LPTVFIKGDAVEEEPKAHCAIPGPTDGSAVNIVDKFVQLNPILVEFPAYA